MRFRPASAALLLVDLQRGFVADDGFVAVQGRDVSPCAAAAARALALAGQARAAGLQVIWTRYVLRPDYADAGLLLEFRPRLKELGALAAGTRDVALIAEPDPRDWVIDKTRNSSFVGTPLMGMLRQAGLDTLAVAGVTTSMCVECTVRDAAQADIKCFVAREAVADFDRARHEASLAAMKFGFARIVGGNQLAAAFARPETEF